MKTELEILKEVKSMFKLHSDHSTSCNGYQSLCNRIKQLEKLKQTHVSEALPIAQNLLNSIESANPNEDHIINDLHKQCLELVDILNRK